MWKSKKWVTSCELQVQIYRLWAQIHKLRDQIYKLQVRQLKARAARLKARVGKLKTCQTVNKQIKGKNSDFNVLNFMNYTRQSGGAQDSTSSTTGLWKITVLPFYYHNISEANKLGSTDSSETILEGTEIKCDQKEMTLKYGTEGK